MNKALKLRDGREVLLRDMRQDDTERSFAFFSALPAEDRKYLRRDVTRREVVSRRTRDVDTGRVVRLVAVEDDEIVADGALELEGHGWGDGVAELRLIVARPYQRLGLGTRLARELYFLAAQRRVERVVARVLRPQRGARRILRRLGFRGEYVLPEHVRDRQGAWQDMIVMRCDLEDLWREMEDAVEETDWKFQW